ncbi:pantoate--beta-alanine ligase [Idiomarina xiamenensis]|uniref:Pantothenate synthetase n=1 Tax=Idiomarina xiamenensis 10-D-4 TaxID=740709 RepID=K2KXZ8_9GAMM|nr:pantoate--beta-alanine ligase [Idiomarina xiamenensis]EKE87449.1 panthothenate synthetase [Idiomarina xiamenensis 10-D-4]
MQQLTNLIEMRAWRHAQRQRVALVPTMGNLHDGHLRLVETAKQHAEVVVVSIFVNPLQFGANEDLDAYPRTLAADCEKLKAAGVDAVFTPTVADMYPRGLMQQTTVNVPEISDILCGASRPGHFRGVATIVCKLFNMVQPDVAVFGRKDYQQLQVIRLMVEDLSLAVEIIGAETVRDASGLALSSRNGYLHNNQQRQARQIYQTLRQLADALHQGKSHQIVEQQGQQLLQSAGFRTDYVAVRRASDLQTPQAADRELVILIAAYIGSTRLIDNYRVDLA